MSHVTTAHDVTGDVTTTHDESEDVTAAHDMTGDVTTAYDMTRDVTVATAHESHDVTGDVNAAHDVTGDVTTAHDESRDVTAAHDMTGDATTAHDAIARSGPARATWESLNGTGQGPGSLSESPRPAASLGLRRPTGSRWHPIRFQQAEFQVGSTTRDSRTRQQRSRDCQWVLPTPRATVAAASPLAPLAVHLEPCEI